MMSLTFNQLSEVAGSKSKGVRSPNESVVCYYGLIVTIVHQLRKPDVAHCRTPPPPLRNEST